ncbi:large ribosomal subunit protein bL9m [Brachionichthys hirsutus]|uniref:large ribosomal subunit protein bL9m n=1 Tax=Brachionichthys hirsutus TaxID=412623 RepID=UPI0036044F16
MWSSGRRVLQDLLSQPAVRSFSLTLAQSTVVVERWWQVPLSKVGSPPRLHPRRHKIYKMVSDTKHTTTEKMELILTQTVPKLGGRGDSVHVKKSLGRNKLLPQGLAVYPSAENKDIFAEELRLLREGKPEDRIQTHTGQKTVEYLRRSKLIVQTSPADFEITKEVLCRHLLKTLQVVIPPDALSFPFESVKDFGDYWCEVTVNGIDTVRIPVSVVLYENERLKTRRQQEAASDPVSAAAVEAEAAGESSIKATEAEASTSKEHLPQTKISEDATPAPSDTPKRD